MLRGNVAGLVFANGTVDLDVMMLEVVCDAW